jgi:hypothetical protein
MYEYLEILEELPSDLRKPIARLIDAMEDNLRKQVAVSREDFSELKRAVEELAKAQRRTEERVNQLAEAQRKTELRVEELAAKVDQLAEAQRRTEERVNQLAEAQRRTEERLDQLAEAQRRTEEELRKLAEAQTQFQRTFNSKIGALGARWGLHSERTFRKAMREMLGEVGYHVERYLRFDEEGTVFGRPDQIELDMVVKDGKLVILEVKSSLSWEEVYTFQKKVEFYERRENRRADRKMIVTAFVEGERPTELARELGIEIITDINDLA